MPTGYSKRTLIEKLGIKPGFKIAFFNPPHSYLDELGELPEGVTTVVSLHGHIDFIHFFTGEKKELVNQFPHLKKALVKTGMIWISWPKGSSKIKTDLNENIIREIGLDNGLVDVKVAAIDDDWSGLKFIYRLKDRI